MITVVSTGGGLMAVHTTHDDMFEYRKHGTTWNPANFHSVEELQRRQRKGITLTRAEKERITKHAENTRKQRSAMPKRKRK